ncbi:methyltransferase domain-containing protein [archaeon]|nr:methyltransferase domain-containing protein [archaeon]
MKQEKVKNYYKKDRVVDKYDKKRFLSKGGKFVDSNEKEIVGSLFKEKKNQNILDVGAGTGRFSILLAKQGHNITCLDQSKEMLEILDKKSKQEGLNLSLIKGDALKLPFQDNIFDACVSIRVLWHFKNPEKLLEEMIRVTKKDGIIIFDLLNKKSLRRFFTPVANRFVYTNLMTKEKMKNIINTSGGNIAEEKEYFILPYFIYRHSPKFLVNFLEKAENKLHRTKFKKNSSVIYFKVKK